MVDDMDTELDPPAAGAASSSVERPAMLSPTEALEVPLQRAIDAAGTKDRDARMSIAVELYDGRRYHRVPGLSWKVNYRTVESAKQLLARIDQAFKEYAAEESATALEQIVPEGLGEEQ